MPKEYADDGNIYICVCVCVCVSYTCMFVSFYFRAF